MSIVIGSLNRQRYLRQTIASVRAELATHEREIIVIDGGSDDGSIRWLTQQKDILTVVQHNRGTWEGSRLPRRSWGYFMNLGFRAARAPYICMLSDDCLVVPGAIRSGLSLLEGQNDRVGGVAFYWRNWPEQRKYWVGLTFGDRMFVNHGLYRREAMAAVGYADEATYSFYHADGDMALRMAEAGWACIDSPSSYIEHFSHANVRQRATNAQLQRADWEAYVTRWRHLTAPKRSWIEREYRDPHGTAAHYWGMSGLVMARWNKTVGPVLASLRERGARHR